MRKVTALVLVCLAVYTLATAVREMDGTPDRPGHVTLVLSRLQPRTAGVTVVTVGT